jgi:hypothetical protein
MATPPTTRTRELDTLLGKIREAANVMLNIDMWDRWGSSTASDAERADKAADLATATRDQDAAKSALEALVTRTRAEAPHEIEAWADAHDAYLAAFVTDCTTKGEADGTAAFVAAQERAAWAEVRAGTRAFVDENAFYVTIDAGRYRELFGLDPSTLERVD